MAMLTVKNLGISFGGLRAVDSFNITIEKGELYGLIGPNGAGKTTIFNLLTVYINRIPYHHTGRVNITDLVQSGSIKLELPVPSRISVSLRIDSTG
jgi:branched-chain amino acid transport system ATP-binding protein